MKLWESMLAMLLCVGLIVAFGLTACGDDDDEADCAGALTRLQGGACEDAITDGIDDLRQCLTDCLGDEGCEDVCWDDFDTDTSVCEPAVSTLLDECGCQVCGNNFESCIVGLDPVGTCVTNIVACFGDCVL